MRWIKLLLVLALNAIPFYGALYLGWSVSTILALYWVENVFIIIATSARIVLHRRLTRRCGHWGGAQPLIEDGVTWIPSNPNAFLREYLGMCVVFTLAHAIFVFAIVFGMHQKHPDNTMWQFSFEQFRNGVVAMGSVLAVDLIAERIRSLGAPAPASWIPALFSTMFALLNLRVAIRPALAATT